MISRSIYTVVLWISLPAVILRLWLRGFREPEYRANWPERFGVYPTPAPKRKLIWLHAVSLGELRAARPLIDGLLRDYPDHQLLLTQMTATGRRAALEAYGDRALVHWLPYDYPFAVERFLAHFSPRIGILMETEVWFNLVRACRVRGVSLLLANARLSEKSLAGYRRLGDLAREAFSSIAIVAAQTSSDADRLMQLGATNVRVTGNLKFEAPDTRGLQDLVRQFREYWAGRKVLLVASTREGEERKLLDAIAGDLLGDALLVIVPRHPQRFDAVAALLRARDLRFMRRSSSAPVPPDCRIFLGDSVGEMPAYIQASDVVIMGGSLGDYGSHNFIEACAEAKPVLLGPSTFNFEEAARAAITSGAAKQFASPTQLVLEAKNLLADVSARQAMSAASRSFCAAHKGATASTLALVSELNLDQAGG